jgi:hypothetical protein
MTYNQIIKKASKFTAKNPLSENDNFRIRRLKRDVIRKSNDITEAVADIEGKSPLKVRMIQRKIIRIADELDVLVDELYESIAVINELS